MDTAPLVAPAAGPGAGPGAWWDARLDRLGVHGPLARDALLAGAVTVLMLLVAGATVRLSPSDVAPPAGAGPWVLGLVAVQSLVLVLRRARPVVCVVAVVATQVGLVAVAPELSFRAVGGFVVAGTLGTHLPTRSALRLAGGAAAVEAVAGAGVALALGGGPDVVLQHVVSAVAVWGASVLVGVYVATRRAHVRLLADRADALERERDARLATALAAERSRLARELHDVAAHHLSGMVVQAAAVERLVERDPAAARAGAAWLREQGRETLDGLRGVVGLLRGDERDDRDDLAPVPGVAALDDLVRSAQALGDDVELEQVGTVVDLPPLADVSVYRVAQQALTNARQHAPGAPVRVRAVHGRDEVVLEVRNGRADAGAPLVAGRAGGTGLAVMRERTALVGGALEAGPEPDGGWCVRLRVPVAQDEGGRA